MPFVGGGHELVLGLEDGAFGGVGLDDVEHLDLPNHVRRRHHRLDAAAFAQQLAGKAGRRDHARLFGGHGHQAVATVDAQIHTQTERQAHDAEHVLHHPVGLLVAQATIRRQLVELAVGEAGNLGDARAAVAHVQSVESGKLAGVHG